MHICTQRDFWLDERSWRSVIYDQLMTLGTSFERLDYDTGGKCSLRLNPLHAGTNLFLCPFKAIWVPWRVWPTFKLILNREHTRHPRFFYAALSQGLWALCLIRMAIHEE